MTYDELRAALSAYMKRTDPETIANEPTALELARLVVGATFFPLESEAVAAPDLVVVDGAAVLPDDFGRPVSVGQDYGYVSARHWRALQSSPRELGGRFTVYGGLLHVHPSLEAVALVYNKKPEAIAGTGSNWLSELYPGVWLHAARAEQYRFIEDIESSTVADQFWRSLGAELSRVSEQKLHEGGMLRMKTR